MPCKALCVYPEKGLHCAVPSPCFSCHLNGSYRGATRRAMARRTAHAAARLMTTPASLCVLYVHEMFVSRRRTAGASSCSTIAHRRDVVTPRSWGCRQPR